MFNFLKKTGRLLSKVVMPFYIPTSSGGAFQVFHILAALGMVSLCDSGHPVDVQCQAFSSGCEARKGPR